MVNTVLESGVNTSAMDNFGVVTGDSLTDWQNLLEDVRANYENEHEHYLAQTLCSVLNAYILCKLPTLDNRVSFFDMCSVTFLSAEDLLNAVFELTKLSLARLSGDHIVFYGRVESLSRVFSKQITLRGKTRV